MVLKKVGDGQGAAGLIGNRHPAHERSRGMGGIPRYAVGLKGEVNRNVCDGGFTEDVQNNQQCEDCRQLFHATILSGFKLKLSENCKNDAMILSACAEGA